MLLGVLFYWRQLSIACVFGVDGYSHVLFNRGSLHNLKNLTPTWYSSHTYWWAACGSSTFHLVFLLITPDDWYWINRFLNYVNSTQFSKPFKLNTMVLFLFFYLGCVSKSTTGKIRLHLSTFEVRPGENNVQAILVCPFPPHGSQNSLKSFSFCLQFFWQLKQASDTFAAW